MSIATIKYGLLILIAVFIAVGCANLPQTSRTSKIHDIKIEKEVSPVQMVVEMGDEVRWVNKRSGSVTVIFHEADIAQVSCENGFSVLGKMRQSATVSPGEYASLCFSEPGKYDYQVRMEATVPGGEIHRTATIWVGELERKGS